MKLRIRNLLGVKSADIVIPEPGGGIALVAGLNGAGKSSILEAARCAALGSHAARGVTTKKAAGALLHDGADAGSATLEWGDGSVRVAWPDGEVTTRGKQRDLGTSLGIGARLWSDLDAKGRAAEFAARFSLDPSVEDIAAFLKTLGADETLAEGLHARVAQNGWDATHLAAKEKATKLKGAWEQVTGDRWGEQKALKWRPEVLDPDEPYLPEDTAAAVEKAREELRDLEARGAVDAAEMVRLRRVAAERDHRQAAVDQAKAAARPLQAAVEALMARRPADPGTGRQAKHRCPHCQKELQIARNANGALLVAKAPAEAMSAADVAKAQAAFAAWQGEFDEATTLAAGAQKAVADAELEVRESDRAAGQLEQLKEAGGAAKPEEIAAARQALADAEAIDVAALRMLKARGIYNDWSLCQPLIQALSPDGVRKTVAARALETVNADLAAVAAAAGWAQVALDPDDLTLTLGGRAFGLLSESEQWRANTTMTLVMAKREGAALVTLDRLDVLERSCRAGALRCVVGAGIPAMIAVTAPDKLKATLPGLKGANAGAVWWVEAGEVQELPW